MSNFPNKIDDDVTLPPVNNNLTEIGGEAINSLRDAVFNIEEEIGIGASGTAGSIANRLGIVLQPDGYIKPSMLNALGFVTLPIYDGYIADNAEIQEHKLKLDHHTQELYNYFLALSGDINKALGWINGTGVKLLPHIEGTAYNHFLEHIFVSPTTDGYFTNRFDQDNPPVLPNFGSKYRDNTTAYSLLNDINNDFVTHQKMDGYINAPVYNIYTLSGDTYPSNFAHAAAGIHLKTKDYTVIPLDTDSVQKLADYIDANSIFLLASRVQNLFTSGISRDSRSSILSVDGYGPPVVPTTYVKFNLLFNNATSPVDNPLNGDDIIQFFPEKSATDNFLFDSQFSLVKVGDVIRVNYGLVQTEFLVKEKKYIQSSNPLIAPSTYAIRIDGKNLDGYDGYARIDRPLFNPNKQGVLSVSAAQTLDISGANAMPTNLPSLIVSHPRGAVALGNGFDPSHFTKDNYNLYLVMYPHGDISEQITMAAIDVTGNRGSTPGAYTLKSIIEATNNAFRKPGVNYRFSAFEYGGQFGIMLNEPYNNAAFSIIAGDFDGTKYIPPGNYSKNVITYDSNGNVVLDPLGFGKNKASIASPVYTGSYASNQSAYSFPTKMFLPLRRNNYYVDGVGVESDKFAIEPYQSKDPYGDGYWAATVVGQSIKNNRIQTTYRVNQNLATSGLNVGKTLVVQPLDGYQDNTNQINYGRFTIESIGINICGGANATQTDITVYDAIQGNFSTNGISPPPVIPVDLAAPHDGYQYALYFGSDSVGFNQTNAFDQANNLNYKRHFEIYVTKEGKTFSLERARMNISGATISVGESNTPLYCESTELSKINITRVSPKLRGFALGTVSRITLHIASYSHQDGTFYGRLISETGANLGPFTNGRKGEVTRFYDETGIDYIDFIFDEKSDVLDFTDKKISIQLFPTLALDDELLLLASVQLNGVTNIVDHILDLRQFGNVSEKDLSTSAISFISAGERLIHANGVINGFDTAYSLTEGTVTFVHGGTALVNGKFVQINNATVKIPTLKEKYAGTPYNILWALCANDSNEYQFVALLDGSSSPNAPKIARDLKVIDISVAQPIEYSINSVFFKDLVNNRKDLTPLWVVEADGYYDDVTTKAIFTSITISDVRKYINSEPLNNTFTWGENTVNKSVISYFHDFNAVKNWLNFYGDVSNTIKIKGAIEIDSYSLDFSQINVPATFEGDGSDAGLILLDGYTTIDIGSNITFKDLKIKFLEDGSIFQTSGNANCSFENVEFLFNSGDTTSYLSLNIQNNNKFVNCVFTRMNEFAMLADNSFVNCSFDAIKSIAAAGGIGAINLTSGNEFIKCSFAKLECAEADVVRSTTGDVSLVNYNTFDGCVFGPISTGRCSGFVMYDNNAIINCKFENDITTHNTTFSFNDGNIIENVLFGTDPNDETKYISVEQASTTADEHFLRIRSNNTIKNFKIRNITCNSDNGSAIQIFGSNNVIDNMITNSIFCEQNGIIINNDGYGVPTNNKILNSTFKAFESHVGIYLNGGKTSDSLGSRTVIDQCFINYSPYFSDSFDNDDNIKFSGGGAIYANTDISNVKITNCILSQNTAASRTLPGPDCGNAKNGPYMVPPLICFAMPPIAKPGKFVDNIFIDKCMFIGSDSQANMWYAAIAFIVSEDTGIDNPYPVTFSDIYVTNNTSTFYNGFIMAGEPSKSYLIANNVIISQNELSYISAYSSPNTIEGSILIEGNSCNAIVSLDYFANATISTPQATGSITIDNNTTQYINIYTNNNP